MNSLTNAPKLSPSNTLTNAEFLITLDQLNNVYFTEFSGIKQNVKRAKYYDGFSNHERTAKGSIISYEPVTIKTPYSVEYANAIDNLINSVGTNYFQLTIRPVKRTNTGIENLSVAYYCSNCLIENYEVLTDANVSSGEDISMISLTFSLDYASKK